MSHSFTNSQIAEQFAEISAALKVQNDDRFRIRAYDNAVIIFQEIPDSLEKYWRLGTLMTIPGIGNIFAQKLNELFTTGKIQEFEDIRASLPAGMFELLKVEGLGPKNAFRLAKTFKLVNRKTAIDKLIKVAKKGEIRALEGFGEKSESLILQNLQRFKVKGKVTRILLYKADQTVEKILPYLKDSKNIEKISPLGSLRRRKDTVGDIDIGIATNNPSALAKELISLPHTTRVIASGEGIVRIVWEDKFPVDFKLVDPKEWGSLLQHFTGSKEHNVALREMAVKKDMSMSEHGMKIKGEWHRYTSEKYFYKALGLAWIPPEIREGGEEIKKAKKNSLPCLLTLDDIKGDLHTHTNYGWINSHDAGSSSIDELLDTAIVLGYEYLGLGDHNPSTSSYKDDQIIKQIQKRNTYIEQIKSSYEKRVKKRTINIFNTLEIDIKPDGSLAVPNAGIDILDYAIVSIHSSFRQSLDKMTERIIKALSNNKVKIFAHPTTRLIGRREEIMADWDKIFNFCLKNHIALEINASPQRLDLSDKMAKKAIKNGNLLVINSDAHHQLGLNTMPYGVDVARRAWATKDNIVNSWSTNNLLKWINR
jgi:DNA polymerase (family 10)